MSYKYHELIAQSTFITNTKGQCVEAKAKATIFFLFEVEDLEDPIPENLRTNFDNFFSRSGAWDDVPRSRRLSGSRNFL